MTDIPSCQTCTATASGGWLKLFYRFTEWEWYGDPNMVALFIHLLLRANYRPRRYRGKVYPRGVLVTSREELRRETGLTERAVRTCLKRLKTTSEITIKTTNHETIITVLNYDKYQGENGATDQQEFQQNDQQTVTQTTNKRPTNDQQYIEERKNINNIYLVVDNNSALAREDFFKDFFSEDRRAVVEQLAMSLGIEVDEVQRLARDALREWEAVGHPPHPTIAEARQHLISHIRKKLAADRRAAAASNKPSRNPIQNSKFKTQNSHETPSADRYQRFRAADPCDVSADDYR